MRSLYSESRLIIKPAFLAKGYVYLFTVFRISIKFKTTGVACSNPTGSLSMTVTQSSYIYGSNLDIKDCPAGNTVYGDILVRLKFNI